MYDERGCKLSFYYAVKDLKAKGWSDEQIDVCFRYVYDGKLNWRRIYKGYEERGVKMYGVEHDKFHDIYNLVKWFRINDYSDEMIDDCISYIFERDINWRGIYEGYENGSIEDTRHLCPVCGKYEFESKNSMEICEICGWQDDYFQFINPDEKPCANQMSLNEAREAYKNGLQVL